MYMKILNVTPYNLSFGNKMPYRDYQDESEIRDFTDDFGGHDQFVRDAIRAHIYSQFLPNYGIDENRTVSYAKTINDVYIPNFEQIGHNSFKGASLVKNIQYLDLLPKSGVSTVIDLVGYYKLEKACKDKNINYLKYPVYADFWGHPIFCKDEVLLEERKKSLSSRSLSKEIYNLEMKKYKVNIQMEREKFIKDFSNLMQTMRNGHFYISCQHGEYRTPNILAMNSYFNPYWVGNKIEPTSEYLYEKMKNMYTNLTPEYKQILGIDKSHEEILKKEFNL